MVAFLRVPSGNAIIERVQDAIANAVSAIGAGLNLKANSAQEEWHEVGALGEPAFLNSWANYGVSEATAAYMKDSMGFVHIKGLIKSGIGAVIFTLPSGYRPVANPIFVTATNNGTTTLFGAVQVLTDGRVFALTGSNTWFSFAGISFKAA